MTRIKIDPAKAKLVAAVVQGSESPLPTQSPDISVPGSLDDMLRRQLTALGRVTAQLTKRATTETMTKDEIQSLATCIKVTMELKAKENELLDGLSDEELAKAASSGN